MAASIFDYRGGRVHFIGIGGSAMSGLAGLLQDEGWQVTVDGRPWAAVSVLKDSLLALRIPAGEHEIRFRYRPACVRNGRILTAAGALLFMAGCLTEGLIPLYRMKRKRKEHD